MINFFKKKKSITPVVSSPKKSRFNGKPWTHERVCAFQQYVESEKDVQSAVRSRKS